MTTHTKDESPIIESKQSFIFGVTVGVAVTALLAMIALGSGILKSPSTDNEDGAVANIKSPTSKTVKTPQAGVKKEVKVEKNDHIRGNKNAKVTIVEFSDIQCPYCSRYHETMREIMQNYPNDVRWVFKHFPLESIHPYARKAAEAAECAGDQNKFWEYTDKLYDNQPSLSEEYIQTAAKESELDMNKFTECLNAGKYRAKVDADIAYGKSLGVQGTPGSFINGLSVPGNLPYSSIEPLIQEALQ
jgi:protein-disulfide isomerase